jgi:hypothetical protein
MGLLDTLKSWLPWSEPTEAVQPLREAAGAAIDDDEDSWRRLTGDGKRDLAPMTHERMQRLAHYLWQTNLVANRLIELPLAYLLAKGVSWKVADEDAQGALDRHWKDGLNAWDIKLPKRVRELSMFGEQCWPVFRSAATGAVRLGYLDPAKIATVVTDPENQEQPIGIVTKKDRKGRARRYRIIVNVPESAFDERTQQIRASFTDGDCFYFRINELSSATRGVSDLLAQMDWLDAYDQFLYGEIDRAAAVRAFVWDVTLTGATPGEVEARAKKITAPRPNSVRVHNEGETWKAEAPALNAYDAANAARLIRNHILGGATVPEHWYGGAEDVNKSTGSSMTEPTEKMLEMRRTLLGYMLEQVGQYVVRSHWGALDRELSAAEADLLGSLVVEWPEMTAKDTTKYAAALQQTVAAMVQLIAESLLTRETALRIIAALAENFGVSIDVEAELSAALAEMFQVDGNTAADGE